MTTVWISTTWLWIFIGFIVLAILAGGVQVWAAFMDRRWGQKRETDSDRLHPHGPGDLHEPRE